jgi:hypothetical protein
MYDGHLKALRDVKRGEFFQRQPGPGRRVFVRGEYDRSTKRISSRAFDDISRVLHLRPSTLVFIGFTF